MLYAWDPAFRAGQCSPVSKQLRQGPPPWVLCCQVGAIAFGACMHSEPGNTHAKALVATLRKRLALGHDLVAPCVRGVQV